MAEKKNNEQQLYVQKEPFEYNGKMYNHYYTTTSRVSCAAER